VSALLVVRPSSLGDVVHALALVSDVVRARPGTAIDWVAEPAFAELPALCPEVRNVVPFALRRWRQAPLDGQTWRDIAVFRRAVRTTRYEVILDLQEQIKGGVIARTARGVRHGFDRASIREKAATWFDDVHHRIPRDAHFATRCRMLAAAAFGYPLEGPPRWHLAPPKDVDGVPSGRFVVVMHATSRAGKLWPEDRWRALIGGLAQAGFATLLPWGNDAEHERSRRLARSSERTHVPPRQSLAVLASLLANANLAIGVDTGLTHLAAALGTPTIALFTETDPAGAGVALAGPHARDLGGCGHVPTLDEVQAAAAELLHASPRC
jgi:lipopolysaccharide heptosyltransferase I